MTSEAQVIAFFLDQIMAPALVPALFRHTVDLSAEVDNKLALQHCSSNGRPIIINLHCSPAGRARGAECGRMRDDRVPSGPARNAR